MNKALKIILMVLLFLAVAVGAVFGYRFFSDRQTAATPIATEGQAYLTTSPNASEGVTAVAEAEEDNLASDSSIEPTTAWPFADRKSESKFEAKESVGYTTTKAAKQNKTESADKTTESKKTSDKETTKETTKKSSSASEGNAKAFLQKLQSGASKTRNGHPVKVDSNGIDVEYKKFAVADLNNDGKDEVFLYAESTKGEEFYGNSYIVYDSTLKNVRTTMVIDEFKDVKFYKSGVFEIVENKFGTREPVPFRVVDTAIGLDIDIAIRLFGVYSYRIVNPLLFFTNVTGNVADSYSRAEIAAVLRDLDTAALSLEDIIKAALRRFSEK